MQTTSTGKSLACARIATAVLGVVTVVGAWLPPSAAAQTKVDEIRFDLVPNPKFLDCMRGSPYEDPKAHATIIRGRQNDTLQLSLTGFKPGLAFDLFTVQRSPFLADKSPDPLFHGSFGLAWYQSDIQTSKHSGNGAVQVKTILLDQIFGFDSDLGMPPFNTFHLGFWFNNPEDAAACGFDPSKPTPFNGEHKAGPVAMISVPVAESRLGPLCTDFDPEHPGKCNP